MSWSVLMASWFSMRKSRFCQWDHPLTTTQKEYDEKNTGMQRGNSKFKKHELC